jgi:hypothetical protein
MIFGQTTAVRHYLKALLSDDQLRDININGMFRNGAVRLERKNQLMLGTFKELLFEQFPPFPFRRKLRLIFLGVPSTSTRLLTLNITETSRLLCFNIPSRRVALHTNTAFCRPPRPPSSGLHDGWPRTIAVWVSCEVSNPPPARQSPFNFRIRNHGRLLLLSWKDPRPRFIGRGKSLELFSQDGALN